MHLPRSYCLPIAIPRTPRQRAFTFAELLLVMVILAVIAGMAGPRYANAITHYRLDSAAKRVAADLALARAQARSTSTPQQVIFTVSSSSYQMPGITTLDRRSTNYAVTLSANPYYATLSSVAFGAAVPPATTVTFDIYGTPDNGGTIQLTENGMTKTITLDSASGATTIQ